MIKLRNTIGTQKNYDHCITSMDFVPEQALCGPH